MNRQGWLKTITGKLSKTNTAGLGGVPPKQRQPANHCCLNVICLAAAIALCGCTQNPTDTKIQLQLNWYPDAQFGGFYAADIHGEYAAEGLDVEIVAGGPDVSVIPKLAMGRVEFGVGNADQVLLARKEGADLIAVMAAMQDCPRCIMVHKSSGIETLQQLQGVTLAMGEGNPFAQFLKNHVPLRDVRIVAYSGSVAKFLIDENYAQQGYVFSEPIVARQRGSDPVALMVSELGFNPYTGVVMTRQKTIDTDPEMVRKFVGATIRGWQRYLESPDQTNAAMHQLNPEMDIESLKEAVDVIRKLCIPEGNSAADLGKMTEARWEQLTRQMIELKLIPPDQQAADAFISAWTP